MTHRYLHGPAIDQIFADEDASGDVLWALADNQRTVRDLVEYDPVLDQTTVANHLKYNAFGQITSASDPSVEFLYAFTGREWDANAELYYYRARWYDPVVGRFVSEDPIGFLSRDANLSRYVRNDAVNEKDPTGWDMLVSPEGPGHVGVIVELELDTTDGVPSANVDSIDYPDPGEGDDPADSSINRDDYGHSPIPQSQLDLDDALNLGPQRIQLYVDFSGSGVDWGNPIDAYSGVQGVIHIIAHEVSDGERLPTPLFYPGTNPPNVSFPGGRAQQEAFLEWLDDQTDGRIYEHIQHAVGAPGTPVAIPGSGEYATFSPANHCTSFALACIGAYTGESHYNIVQLPNTLIYGPFGIDEDAVEVFLFVAAPGVAIGVSLVETDLIHPVEAEYPDQVLWDHFVDVLGGFWFGDL